MLYALFQTDKKHEKNKAQNAWTLFYFLEGPSKADISGSICLVRDNLARLWQHLDMPHELALN
jgi:hypothetical protein